MKKNLLLALALLFGATCTMAQTPDEAQASVDRVAILKQEAPKDCGVPEIDDVVAKCKSVGNVTVGISALTATLAGDDAAALTDLYTQIETATKDLAGIAPMLGNAATALKGLKNPMKVKSAAKSLDYAKEVVKTAGEELVYQGKLVAEMMKK